MNYRVLCRSNGTRGYVSYWHDKSKWEIVFLILPNYFRLICKRVVKDLAWKMLLGFSSEKKASLGSGRELTSWPVAASLRTHVILQLTSTWSYISTLVTSTSTSSLQQWLVHPRRLYMTFLLLQPMLSNKDSNSAIIWQRRKWWPLY